MRATRIPLNARIFSIVDVFDALTSERPYKKSWPFDQAMTMLRRERGSHFELVKKYYRSIEVAR